MHIALNLQGSGPHPFHWPISVIASWKAFYFDTVFFSDLSTLTVTLYVWLPKMATKSPLLPKVYLKIDLLKILARVSTCSKVSNTQQRITLFVLHICCVPYREDSNQHCPAYNRRVETRVVFVCHSAFTHMVLPLFLFCCFGYYLIKEWFACGEVAIVFSTGATGGSRSSGSERLVWVTTCKRKEKIRRGLLCIASSPLLLSHM